MKDATVTARRKAVMREAPSSQGTPAAETTFDEFIPRILATESTGQQECYGAYWRLLLTEWGSAAPGRPDTYRDPAFDEPVQSRCRGPVELARW
ncbi:hypothetical protein [Nocardia rhamnosiphila]|uniref:hypothetical protein n=1 Tax=Nocardia rhamnosiphila TaxID=426716 RepID=UPI000AB2BC25|nr:hypothetical protein [Nocardia rhamnosiphila]